MPKIDEDFMKELISQGVPTKQDNNKTNAPYPAAKRNRPRSLKRCGWRKRHTASARAVRVTTGKPTFRKWNWQTDSPCT